MIAGLPLVFLLLAQQLCQTLVLERGGRLHLAVVPVHRVSSFWKRCTQRILILILFAPIPLGGERKGKGYWNSSGCDSRRADGQHVVASGAVLRIAAPDAGRSG